VDPSIPRADFPGGDRDAARADAGAPMNTPPRNEKLVQILFGALEKIDEFDASEVGAFLDARGVSFARLVLVALQQTLAREPTESSDDGVTAAMTVSDAELTDPELVRARREWEAAHGRLWGELQRHKLQTKRFNQVANVCVRELAREVTALLGGEEAAGERLRASFRRATDDARARAETLECVPSR
jgi:hypothetical protein